MSVVICLFQNRFVIVKSRSQLRAHLLVYHLRVCEKQRDLKRNKINPKSELEMGEFDLCMLILDSSI